MPEATTIGNNTLKKKHLIAITVLTSYKVWSVRGEYTQEQRLHNG